MEALTATSAGAVSLPMFSAKKSRGPSSRRLLRCSTSPKNDSDNINTNSEPDIKPDSSDSRLVPVLRNRTLSKARAVCFSVKRLSLLARIRSWNWMFWLEFGSSWTVNFNLLNSDYLKLFTLQDAAMGF
ncbi:UNVERIFIED_CONTAM: hypothetical protein Slati_2566000 [Sesamum latifolium]|uniref:Uncharacterized protein n=1 Tax=Sesamum latifolium TaxID=2727402 RepID=A0AAW2VWH9_9LAMI